MAYFFIIRPINCIITFISVFAGAWVAREMVFGDRLFFAGAVGFLVCAFGNIVNDIADIEVDKINNPKRPLAAGKVSKSAVLIMAVLFSLVALTIAGIIGTLPLVLAIMALVFLFFYAVYFKKTPIGNLVVALIAGLSFVLGGAITGNRYCIIPFVFALLVHTAREIVKDQIDIEGDRIGQVHSLPILLGEEKANYISGLILALLCLAMPLPFVFRLLGIAYIVVLVAGAYPLLIYVILRLLNKPKHKELIRLSILVKVSMGVGLIAFILG